MNKYRRWTKQEDDLLLELYLTKTNKELALIFDRRVNKISRRLTRLGHNKPSEVVGNHISQVLKAKYASGQLSQKGKLNSRYIDGRKNEHLWRIYLGIKQRCYNKKYKQYKDYGGRGIKMCEEWFYNYPSFRKHMEQLPKDGDTIDRIDNDGDYEPGNVRWATRALQNANKRLPNGYNLHHGS